MEAAPATVETFLKTVLRSALLSRVELQETLRGLPRAQRDDAEAVADYLVHKGQLSRFQARKLLDGAPLGLVLGHYHILSPIGKGGMGTVYLARDSRSQTLLALKILPPKRARAEERVLARFRREMELSQRVAHPHIAWTFEVGVAQGVYYIAMEYIPGKSLYRLVQDEGPLDVPRAARLFAEVASALDHAHHQGLIHRDLKPSNILITPHDHAKLLDLGLALRIGETSTAREIIGGAGYVVGTMDYLPPEQAENAARVDPRTDLYALGCTLYYALTGQPPFPGGSVLERIQRHRTEEPVPLTELNPAVPPEFAALVARLMAKDPDERLATAAAVEEALQPWASGTEVQPLDRRTDEEYEHAIALLETAEPPKELLQEEIPVGILVSPPVPDTRLSRNGTLAASPTARGADWVVLGFFVLGGFLVGVVGLLGLLFLWFSH